MAKTKAEMKMRFHQRLEEKLAKERARPVEPPPRYDDVFYQGTAWLDRLARENDYPDKFILVNKNNTFLDRLILRIKNIINSILFRRK